MAPRKRRVPATSSNRTRNKQAGPVAQDPYQSLVAEYLASEVASSANDSHDSAPSSKRRRVTEKTSHDEDSTSIASKVESNLESRKQQIVYQDFDDEDTEDESDIEFEDVDVSSSKRAAPKDKPLEDLNLVLQGDDDGNKKGSRGLSASRRQALTAAHRRLRMSVHKMHLMALISHIRLRNKWCNDVKVQAKLRGLVSSAIRKMLKDDPTQSQWQRSRALKMGLEKAIISFKEHFDVSARGLSRAYWSETVSEESSNFVPEDIDLPTTKNDFLEHASKRSGSRDIGAQLFCSMLRAVNLDVRLVCSLQPLPLQALMKPALQSTPARREVPFHDTRTGITSDHPSENHSTLGRKDPNTVSSGVRRFGHAPTTPGAAVSNAVPYYMTPPRKKKLKESSFPVYWVEVFNIADQKWIPVDPLVLKLIEKPSKFEPPANDYQNSMSYVVAIDEDGYLKDVTRRYAHAYNAKTRRYRLDAARDGNKWWKRIMRLFRDPLPQDRDQVEDSELAAKEAREPMPRNIVEFKNHPYYALERHLRANEVLNPRRQIGTVSAGINKPLEPIYRRQDVHLVRSADAWFRQGRQIKLGEEPLKYVEPKANQREKAEEDLDDQIELSGAKTGTPLFAAYQTQQYIPAPVFNGIIPKNIFGNIDVYVPSMVPAGGVWVNHPFANGAAKLLGIDWADAVTGFEFRGRTGTAVMKGVVVAGEYHEALVTTIEGFQHAFEEERSQQRTAQVLFAWKRFLLALRIRKRIQSYHVEGEDLEQAAAANDTDDTSGSEYEDLASDEGVGGGFVRDHDQAASDSDEDPNEQLKSLSALTPLDPESESEPISKAVLDSRMPILSTWGPSLPAETLIFATAPETNLSIQGDLVEATGFEADTGDHGGGGFIVEHDANENGNAAVSTFPTRPDTEEVGGGFIPEDDEDEDESNHEAIHKDANPTVEQSSNPAGGFILEPSPAASMQTSTIVLPEDIANTTSIMATAASAMSAAEDKLLPSLNRESSRMSNRSNRSSMSVDSERGSLLSHDPDDEDAEPEWL